MNKLRRINTTDLQELRDILNQDTESQLAENVDSTSDKENPISKTEHYKCETKNEEEIVSNGKKCKVNQISSRIKEDTIQERQPFIITGIRSKHRSNKLNNFFNQEKLSNEFYGPSQSKLPVYKSVHYKTIVETENRLERKYDELEKLLQRDILMRTVSICDQSMNEAKQLIQNSLAASRIVSSFLQETSRTGRLSGINQPISQRTIASLDIDSTRIPIPKSISEWERGKSVWNIEESICHPEIGNSSTNVFGISAVSDPAPSSLRQPGTTRTDHYLSSEEPFIQQWVSKKNRQIKLERRLKREEMKIERAISVGALAVQEKRKEAAEEAFKQWVAKKKRTKQRNPEEINAESSDSSSDIGLPQAGRQPRPQRTSAIRRSISLMRSKSSVSFSMNANLKMKVAGHMMSLSNYEPVRESARFDAISNYPKPPTKKYSALVRPQTAIPQPRKTKDKSDFYLDSISKQKERKLKKRKKSAVVNGIKIDNNCGQTEEQRVGTEGSFSASNSENEMEKIECIENVGVKFKSIKDVKEKGGSGENETEYLESIGSGKEKSQSIGNSNNIESTAYPQNVNIENCELKSIEDNNKSIEDCPLDGLSNASEDSFDSISIDCDI